MNTDQPEVPRTDEGTLESWKEIAEHLQRNTTTARRWEKEEGLPVHRHNHRSRSSVYAYPSEIDAWRASRKAAAEPPPPVPLWRSLSRSLAFGVTMVACLIMVGNGIRPASAQSAGAPAKRLLCTGCGDSEANFSPDGRLMVFTDWDSGDVAIRDMSTGQVKRLLAKPSPAKDSGKDSGIYFAPVLSPDLRQIVYVWGDEKGQRAQLRVMPNQPGGMSRVLIDSPEKLESVCVPRAWFPDGKSILALTLQITDKTQQLARVSVSGGAVQVLKSLEWRSPSPAMGISPDGRYIVYSALAVNPSKPNPAPADLKDQHIYVLAADGSSETDIVKTAGINQNPVWAPDGRHILFTSDRSGKFDLWAIAVQNGKAVGPASLVTSEIGKVSAVGMRGGSYYYYYTSSQSETEYVNIADFAPAGDGQSHILHATERFVGIRPTWSPDGKSIAFRRHHPGRTDDYDVVVHSLETGDERTYLTNFGATDREGGANWFHDGKTIVAGIGHVGGSRLLYKIDLKTGEFKSLPTAPAPHAFSPDEKTLYVARNDEKAWAKLPAHILAVDLSKGQEKEIFTMPEPGYAWFLLTPDGRTFIARRLDEKTQAIHFYRFNIDGTGYREIYTIAQKDFRDNFTVTKDGRWILLARRNDDQNWQLIRIPIEGGEPESTGVVLDATLYPRSIDLSPDGSRIAFTTQKRVAELWTLDNVLSALK